MSTLFDLAGKAALVVGGHGGIGKAIALGLADAGAEAIDVNPGPVRGSCFSRLPPPPGG